MIASKFEDRLFLRYLRILGLKRQSPGFEYLEKIISAQISKIPFENISKLFYKKRLNIKQLIDFELYLEGIEKYGFGGTCYSNNFYLNRLLSWLGYDIKLCGADMKNPDVHIVNIVKIKNREFLIDSGNAAPFSKPIPLDLSSDYIINMGVDRHVLKPRNNSKRSKLELYRKGDLIHGYLINPKARKIDEFEQVIKDSFKESSTFMNALLLARMDFCNLIVIHNMSMIKSTGNISIEHSLNSVEQLASIINKYFNIPKLIVIESINNLQIQKNAWS